VENFWLIPEWRRIENKPLLLSHSSMHFAGFVMREKETGHRTPWRSYSCRAFDSSG
jgi:hypothetical protein